MTKEIVYQDLVKRFAIVNADELIKALLELDSLNEKELQELSDSIANKANEELTARKEALEKELAEINAKLS